ncbi:MAG: hypothetical protein JWL73_3377 [Actinomycetia bacterium]|nr:hypothetical protein [Actinomycetes bacterium]
MRRFSVMLAVVALAAFALGAAPASAAPAASITVSGGGPGLNVKGTGTSYSGIANVVQTTGGDAYCADLFTHIGIGDTVDLVSWTSTTVPAANLPALAGIINNEFPETTGFALVGTNDEKAASVQTALWHYSSNYDLDTTPGANPPNVVANYQTILGRVAASAYPQMQTQSLTITPSSTAGAINANVGPYTVHSTVPTVTLSVTGADLVDGSGAPIPNTIGDGGQFWLRSSNVGSATVTATANAPAGTGLFYVRTGLQRLIAPSQDPLVLTASASASFAATPPPPTTTPPPTTSPSPPTTTTAVQVSPITVSAPATTAAPGTSGAGVTVGAAQVGDVNGTLPRTGSNDTSLALTGYRILLLGIALLSLAYVLRHRSQAFRTR